MQHIFLKASSTCRSVSSAAVSTLPVPSSTPPCRKLLNWLLPLSLPLRALTVSCMALYELSAALNVSNSHCSPEISVSLSGDLFTLWNSVHFPSVEFFFFLPQTVKIERAEPVLLCTWISPCGVRKDVTRLTVKYWRVKTVRHLRQVNFTALLCSRLTSIGR